MLNIDLSGKKAFIAGIGDDKGFGFSIAKSLAEAGCEILIGTWTPIVNIFEMSWRNKKFDESRKLKNNDLFEYKKLYPIDCTYDYPEDIQDLTLLFTYPDGGYPTAVITPRTPGLTAADGINRYCFRYIYISV